MICPDCQECRDEKDFYGKEICYKCQYANKINLKKIKLRKCKQCERPIPQGRWKYCCPACADEGAVFLKRNYWTNKFKLCFIF